MIAKTITVDAWDGCYAEGWKGIIVDEAFAHPAKISYSLSARIYDHAFKAGWVKPGDRVVDPFGGIGGTAIHAACHGLQWFGCELEPRFKDMADQNFDLWARKWGSLPEWVQPRIVCGDSRKLFEVLYGAEAGSLRTIEKHRGGSVATSAGVTEALLGTGGGVAGIVSSPPYAGNEKSDYRIKDENGQDRDERRGFRQGQGCFRGSEGYGQTPGQLGAMRDADFDAVVSSPPYSEGLGHGGKNYKEVGAGGHRTKESQVLGYGDTAGQLGAMIVGSPPFVDQSKNDARPLGGIAERQDQGGSTARHYGTTEGQMGAMVVGSPPFEGSTQVNNNPDDMTAGRGRWEDGKNSAARVKQDYADYESDASLGNSEGETFWSSARDIVAQCHMILRPGGHAIWVCKDFVRAKKRVPFSDQWQALCESLGFRLVCRHRAMLVKVGGTQKLLDGGEHTTTRERKSFFRRLAEKKGSPRIDWEDVICLERI